MKHDPSAQRARRGLAIMAGLLLAAVLVFNMDAIVDRFRGYVDVVAVVLETSGVRIGSPVWVEGIEAGRVTAIDVVDLGTRGAVALHLRLEDRARRVVRRGSRAHTARHRFIGEPTVRISAGPAGSPAVETGDTLYPSEQISLDTLLARGRVMAPALDSLATALAAVDRLVGTRRPALDPLVDRLAVASDEAAALRADLEGGSLERWLRDPALGERLDRLQRRVSEVAEAARGFQRYGDPALRGRVASVGRRSERLGRALDELEQRISDPRGTVARLEQDTALALAIEGVRAQIDSLRAEGLGFALRMFLP